MTIFLSGFPSSGKTSLGKKVARRLACSFIDLDNLIETACGVSCRNYYIKEGEVAFRNLESSLIDSLDCTQNPVVSLGGGAVLNNSNLLKIKQKGLLIYLKVDKEILWGRLRSKKAIPAYLDTSDTKSSFEMLYKARQHIYEESADVTLHLSCKSERTIVNQIVEVRRRHGK
ncbi:Shikimate kinase [Chlamydiales bacterium STE3]|nr:Shikimate kinase [Chlamydiales bacterium STE3]